MPKVSVKSPASKTKASKATKKTEKPDEKRAQKHAYYVVVKTAVSNILGNTMYVLEATKCKKILPSHLKAVAMIQNTILKNKIASLPSKKTIKKGGDPTMASEYYGTNSGRYFDIAQVEKLETHMFADAALSRAEMPIKVGGGSKKLVSASMVRSAMKEYSQENNKCLRCSKEAFNIIHSSVNENIRQVEAKTGGNIEVLQELINSDVEFAHLRQTV
jgi:hypothetical protein